MAVGIGVAVVCAVIFVSIAVVVFTPKTASPDAKRRYYCEAVAERLKQVTGDGLPHEALREEASRCAAEGHR